MHTLLQGHAYDRDLYIRAACTATQSRNYVVPFCHPKYIFVAVSAQKGQLQGICAHAPAFQNAGRCKVHIGCPEMLMFMLTARRCAARAVDINRTPVMHDSEQKPMRV